MGSKPAFLGIGGQRCGTTWIFQCLAEHPQVIAPQEKEIHYFSYWHHKGYEWYERHFPDVPSGSLTGEFSTSYLYDYYAPERVMEYNSNMKIIVSLRNPVERAYSQHKHETKMLTVSGKNLLFEHGLQNNPSYIEHGRYHKYLKRWLEVFPPRQVLILFYEELAENPLQFIQKVYQFCEIDESFTPTVISKRVNASDVARNISFYRKIRKVSKWSRKAFAGPIIEKMKKAGLDRALFGEKSEAKVAQKLGYDPEIRSALKKLFEPENEKLFVLLGKRPPQWL